MIQIVTDSMSDIRQEDADRFALTVLPQHVLFGEESYLDGITLTCDQFYEKMAAFKDLPKTSQVTPEAFAHAFEKAAAQGDDVVCITGSSKLSGTYQSATIARDMQPDSSRIYLIDSRNATLGQQALLWEAVRLRDEGATAQEMMEKISALVKRVSLVGVVDDLKHLVRGGRLSSSTARIGSTLKLKPGLRLTDGKLEQDGLTRGKKRAFEWMVRQLYAQPRDEGFPIYLASANASEELHEFRDALVKEGFPLDIFREVSIGPIVGTHTGQGVLAMSWVRLQA